MKIIFIESNKKLPTHVQNLDHPFGKYYLTEASIKKMLPLLSMQTYINKIDIFNNQKIDIDLNFFRELPISFNIDSVRWYFHLTGIHAELDKPYLINIDEHKIKNKVVIVRSNRRRNHLINYNFLKNYIDKLSFSVLICIGVEFY